VSRPAAQDGAPDPRPGQQLGDSWTFPVEQGKLRELAVALHEPDPVWFDEDVARAQGFTTVPLLPTASVIGDLWREGGFFVANVAAAGLDMSRVLHGEVTWSYVLPIEIGDELTATCRVSTVDLREGRRGGRMKRVGIQTQYVNQRGELTLVRDDVLLEVTSA
jgi:acyl dehydratase